MSGAVRDLFAIDRRSPIALRGMIAAQYGKSCDSQDG